MALPAAALAAQGSPAQGTRPGFTRLENAVPKRHEGRPSSESRPSSLQAVTCNLSPVTRSSLQLRRLFLFLAQLAVQAVPRVGKRLEPLEGDVLLAAVADAEPFRVLEEPA